MKVRVKENACIARLAAKKLKTERIAIVIDKTIFLYKVSAAEFMKDKKWLRHEVTHVRQFQQCGFMPFLFLYMQESIKRGYDNNSFEVEAKNNENNEKILEGIEFVLPQNH